MHPPPPYQPFSLSKTLHGLVGMKDVVLGVEVVSTQLPKSSLSSFMNVKRKKKEGVGAARKAEPPLPTFLPSPLPPRQASQTHVALWAVPSGLWGLKCIQEDRVASPSPD